MNNYLRNRRKTILQDIYGEEEQYLRWAMEHQHTSEFFITQTFVGGWLPNRNKPVRDYILTFLLNLTNHVGTDVYAIGGSYKKKHRFDRASHFHLMVSIPLVIPPSVVMRFGTQGRNGRKLSRWGRNTCDVYDPMRGGFPYILTKHEWECFTPFHPKGK